MAKPTIQERIDSSLKLGALCDEYSDYFYARGALETGTYWGNRAIAYYTDAERLSGDAFLTPPSEQKWNREHN